MTAIRTAEDFSLNAQPTDEVYLADADYQLPESGVGAAVAIGRVEYGMRWDDCSCDGGLIANDYFGIQARHCMRCNGTGRVAVEFVVLVREAK